MRAGGEGGGGHSRRRWPFVNWNLVPLASAAGSGGGLGRCCRASSRRRAVTAAATAAARAATAAGFGGEGGVLGGGRRAARRWRGRGRRSGGAEAYFWWRRSARRAAASFAGGAAAARRRRGRRRGRRRARRRRGRRRRRWARRRRPAAARGGAERPWIEGGGDRWGARAAAATAAGDGGTGGGGDGGTCARAGGGPAAIRLGGGRGGGSGGGDHLEGGSPRSLRRSDATPPLKRRTCGERRRGSAAATAAAILPSTTLGGEPLLSFAEFCCRPRGLRPRGTPTVPRRACRSVGPRSKAKRTEASRAGARDGGPAVASCCIAAARREHEGQEVVPEHQILGQRAAAVARWGKAASVIDPIGEELALRESRTVQPIRLMSPGEPATTGALPGPSHRHGHRAAPAFGTEPSSVGSVVARRARAPSSAARPRSRSATRTPQLAEVKGELVSRRGWAGAAADVLDPAELVLFVAVRLVALRSRGGGRRRPVGAARRRPRALASRTRVGAPAGIAGGAAASGWPSLRAAAAALALARRSAPLAELVV